MKRDGCNPEAKTNKLKDWKGNFLIFFKGINNNTILGYYLEGF
jgi:hypothetical protein